MLKRNVTKTEPCRTRNGVLTPEQLAREDRLYRAGLIGFCLAELDGRVAVWATETIPRHGAQSTTLPDRIEGPDDYAAIAAAMLGFLARAGLVSPRTTAYAVLLAAEVLPLLPRGWRLTGRQILGFVARDLSGRDVASQVERAVNE